MRNIFYLLLLLISINCNRHFTTTNNIEDGISISSMAKEGINETLINSLDSAITKGVYPNIHSLLIAKNNKLVYENYWPGTDQNWRHDVGMIAHSKDSLHDIRSITKSFTSACVGIAIAQGKIKSVSQRIFDFFPEYARQDTGLKSTITIKHLLTMSSGLLWNEDLPSDDAGNSQLQMEQSKDPVGFVLSRPLGIAPGKVWNYSGGSTQLLAAIIEKASGKTIYAFAKEYLLDPLGITNFTWERFPGKHLYKGYSGLRITSRELLKFGLMYAQNGKSNNRQVIPASWIKESFESQIQRPSTINPGDYGYQFWIYNYIVNNKPLRIISAFGNGDQRIFWDKPDNLVVIFTAGNYYKWNNEKNAHAVLKEYILPAIIKKNE